MMMPPVPPDPPAIEKTPGQIAIDAVRNYVALKEGMANVPDDDIASRSKCRDDMRELRCLIASYIGIPYMIWTGDDPTLTRFGSL